MVCQLEPHTEIASLRSQRQFGSDWILAYARMTKGGGRLDSRFRGNDNRSVEWQRGRNG